MKSIVITFLLFALVMLAINYRVFEILSSGYMYGICFVLLVIVMITAFKILGNPLKNKDEHHEQK